MPGYARTHACLASGSARPTAHGETAAHRRASLVSLRSWPRNVPVVKKALVLLVCGFALYYLLTAPTQAADAVEGAFNAVIEAFGNVGVFVQELFE